MIFILWILRLIMPIVSLVGIMGVIGMVEESAETWLWVVSGVVAFLGFFTWLVKLGTYSSTSFLLGFFATRCLRKSHHLSIRLRPPILHHRAMHLDDMLLDGIVLFFNILLPTFKQPMPKKTDTSKNVIVIKFYTKYIIDIKK